MDTQRLAAISRWVALEQGCALDVHSLTVSNNVSGRPEILVTITGCHRNACGLLVGITYATAMDMEVEFRSKLRQAIGRHRKAHRGSTSPLQVG